MFPDDETSSMMKMKSPHAVARSYSMLCLLNNDLECVTKKSPGFSIQHYPINELSLIFTRLSYTLMDEGQRASTLHGNGVS
jgi:hypothetical protein